MSIYLKLHNEVKKCAGIEWLTPTQQNKLNEIRKRMELDELINLYGKHGTGKTFLCWILSRLGSATYTPIPLVYPLSKPAPVIIDNFNYFEKNSFREISAKYTLQRVNKLIIVTIRPFLEEQCARIEMNIPNQEDIKKIIENLQGIAPLLTIEPMVDSFSIWEIFQNLEVSRNEH